MLSYASDTRQSVQSSASEYILPGLGIDQNKTYTADESSHWHSSPLAFALLPAVGGLVFTNGSAFVTDILLLGLAAGFLNWSCRLPWYVVTCGHKKRADVGIGNGIIRHRL